MQAKFERLHLCKINKRFKSPYVMQLCLTVFLSNMLLACSDKPVTDFKDKSPIWESDSEDQSLLSQEIALNYASFSDAKKSLEDQIQELSMLDKIANIEVELTLSTDTQSADANQESISYASNVFTIPTEHEIVSNVDAFLNSVSLSMGQVLHPPTSTLSLTASNYKSDSSWPAQHYSVLNAEIDRVLFLNGEMVTPSIFTGPDSITTDFDPKVVKELSSTVTFEYPIAYSEIILNDTVLSVKSDEYDIEFKRLAPNQIELKYPVDINAVLVEVSGWHVNKKPLEEQRSTEHTLPNSDVLNYFKEINVLYQSSLEKLNKGDFVNAQELKDYIAHLKPNEPNDLSIYTTRRITYSGPVDTVRLVLKSKQTETATKKFTVSNLEIEDNTTGYYIAYDRQAQKAGLVNELGEWFIQPDYSDLTFNMGNYYRNAYTQQNYFLDTQAQALRLIDYRPEYNLSSDLMVVSAANPENMENDNTKGVLNRQTKQLVVPIEFNDVEINDELIIVAKGMPDYVNRYGAYSKEGQLVLPAKYSELSAENNFIYGTLPSENINLIRHSVFDYNGKEVTPLEWNAVGRYAEDQLLLVKKCQVVQDPVDHFDREFCEHKFLDAQGNTAFSLEDIDYSDISVFSNGFAQIMNEEKLFGYINTKGKLVIPFKYLRNEPFNKKYALVTAKNGDEMLIDSNEKIFKNFKDTIKQYQYSYDRPTVYLLKDGSRFNSYGERLVDSAD